MVKVLAPRSLPSSSRRIGASSLNSGTLVKRKTPSELRGEQLKRASAVDLTDESSSPLSGFTNELDNRLKRPGLSRYPRYTGTRVDEVFPAKKSRFRMLSGKENAKENSSVEQTSNLKNLPLLSNSAAKREQGISCLEGSVASSEVCKGGVLQACQTFQKCSQEKFRSVTELSSAADRSSGLTAIDMGKALKGLASLEPCVSYGLAAHSSERCGDSTSNNRGNFFYECHVPSLKSPLDLTLKTSMWVVSSSVNGIHRSVVRGTMSQFTFQHSPFKGQNINGHSQVTSNAQGFKVLHSWTYPQSVLPSSLIPVLSSSTAGGVELEFSRKRQEAWEDSFRDLYYMLRNDICGIFYVCTSLFVVMFTGGDGSGRSKCLCNAYISQSTRGLRSLLREHDVCFCMPLCHSKVEQVTTEDMVELSEIEKRNLGQTQRLSAFSDVDNSPESLWFSAATRISFLTSLSGMDVPVLYSPVPFQNAALSSPEIKCMEMRRAEHIAALNGSIGKDSESAQGSSDGHCCSIEIKGAFLPPWIICGICALMGSEGRNFEASFVTEPSSIGLNVAFKSTCEKSGSEATASESLHNCSGTFGIPEATVTSCLWSHSLKGLKYSDGYYTASLSPV